MHSPLHTLTPIAGALALLLSAGAAWAQPAPSTATAAPELGTVTVEVGGGGSVVPAGGVPVTPAMFVTPVANTSATVTVYVAVHVVDAPADSVVNGHTTTFGATILSSLTTMPVISTLPVFVTT